MRCELGLNLRNCISNIIIQYNIAQAEAFSGAAAAKV